MKNDVFEKLLSDGELGGMSELEAELEKIVSQSSPDLDKADRLVDEILSARGEKPRKIDVSQALSEIRSQGTQEQFGDEVRGVDVITGRKRRGTLRRFAVLASAAAVVGCITALRLHGGTAPDRSETPDNIVAAVTTVTQTVPAQTGQAQTSVNVQTTAAVTTACTDNDKTAVTENAQTQTIAAEDAPADSTAPAQEEAVQTTAPEDNSPAVTTDYAYSEELLDFVDSHDNIWIWTGTLHIDFDFAANPAYDSAAADPYGIAEAFREGVNGLSFMINAPKWLPDDLTVFDKSGDMKGTVGVMLSGESSSDINAFIEKRAVCIDAEEWYDEKNVSFYLNIDPKYSIIHDISECSVDGRVGYRLTETYADGFELPGKTIVVYSADSVLVTYRFFNLTDEEIDKVIESIGNE